MLQASKQSQAGRPENKESRPMVKIAGISVSERAANYARNIAFGLSGHEAAVRAGYKFPDSEHQRLSRDDRVQRLISAEFQRLVLTEGAPKAYSAAVGILDDPHAPPGVRWKVSQWFLEAAGAKPDHVAASASQNGHKALEDMSLAELEAIAAAARQKLDTLPTIQGTARTVEQPKQQESAESDLIEPDESLIE